MNDKAFENKVNRDYDKAKKDLAILGDDGIAGLTRIFEKLADDTQEKVSRAVKTFNKEVGKGLSQYNAQIQDVADRVPGGFSKKTARYPWVTITVSLAIGLLVGGLLKPARQPLV